MVTEVIFNTRLLTYFLFTYLFTYFLFTYLVTYYLFTYLITFNRGDYSQGMSICDFSLVSVIGLL